VTPPTPSPTTGSVLSPKESHRDITADTARRTSQATIHIGVWPAGDADQGAPLVIPPYPEGRDLLAGKVVVVTAAAGTGIGSATARRCLEEGAQVLISDQHQRRLGETLDALKADHHGQVAALPCDVTRQDQVDGLIAGAVDTFGRLDVMINNAGLGGTRSILDMTDDEWSKVLDVTLNGTFRCTRAALRRMVEQGHGGVIVNNASVVGWRAQRGQAHYAAAKAGVMALTRCAALDAADHGVRVNAVAPSLAAHPFLAKVTSEDLLTELAGREAFGRAAQPWEVANVMVFLASDYASYLTGEVVSVSSQHP
jgi:3-oxoacyl-[acyl-carrier protein] reductase